jgi:DNA invertase Pin-like site-specific DNA recombinase
VRVVSVTQQIDLSGTVGHLVAGVLFAIAEIELQNTKERQAAGIAAAKKRDFLPFVNPNGSNILPHLHD